MIRRHAMLKCHKPNRDRSVGAARWAVFALSLLLSACVNKRPDGMGELESNPNYLSPETVDLISPRDQVDERLVLSRQQAENYEYRIGEYDVLEIEVFQVEELRRKARVNSRGYVSVPLIGAVKVEGLAVEEAERLIAEKLAENYLQDPHVTIFIEEYESQRFTVEGEVKDPGVFPIKGPTTLLQAIAMADGLGRLADTEGIILFRTDKQGRTVGYIVDINRLRLGEVQDPVLADEDMIIVPRANDKALIEGITRTLRGFVGFGML